MQHELTIRPRSSYCCLRPFFEMWLGRQILVPILFTKVVLEHIVYLTSAFITIFHYYVSLCGILHQRNYCHMYIQNGALELRIFSVLCFQDCIETKTDISTIFFLHLAEYNSWQSCLFSICNTTIYRDYRFNSVPTKPFAKYLENNNSLFCQ